MLSALTNFARWTGGAAGMASILTWSLMGCQVSPLEPPPEAPSPTATGQAPRIDAGAARAVQITSEDQLIGGPAAQGRVGDYLLSNQKIRVIVQAPGDDAGPGPYGGTIIDADVVRASGAPGQDSFGEMSLFFNLALTMDAISVKILDSGTTSGTAKVQACGPDYLFDFLDLSAALPDEDWVTRVIPYDTQQTFGLDLCTTYSLGPDDNYVHATTTFTNSSNETLYTPVGDILDTGGDVENFIPNPTGERYKAGKYEYDYGGFGSEAFAPMEYMAFFGPGVSYGYLPPYSTDELEAMQASIAGVTVTVVGTTKIVKVVRGKHRVLTEIPARGSASFSRDIIIGSSLGEITDTVRRLRGDTVGTLKGTVREASTLKPLANVRVSVVGSGGVTQPVTQYFTDANGQFQGTLPVGNYGLVAAEGFDFMADGRPGLLTPVGITIFGNQVTTKDLSLAQTGTVNLKVLDGGDATGQTLLSAKALFFGTDSSPPIKAIMDITDDHVGESNLAHMSFLINGAGAVSIKPGTYDVVFERGFEYDLKVIRGLVVSAGKVASATATLTRVIDTAGYVSGDLHVHGINSPDSPVSYDRRVASFLTEGVEVLVSTDHDFVTDYQPTIEAMQVWPYITSIAGDEVTTFSSGHFNVFPMEVDSLSRTHGAVNWMEAWNNCLTFPFSSAVQDNLTVPQLFKVAQTCSAADARFVEQVNHPRGSFQGYFSQLGLNLGALGTSGEVTADPMVFRMPDGADLFDPASFNTLEILNGNSVATDATVMNDWFGLMNLGYPKAGSAVSDTHTEVLQAAGYGRTWARVSNDNVGQDFNNATFPGEFAGAVSSMQVTAGIGPFVTTSAAPQAGGSSVAMGELLKGSNGKVNLKVRIQNPSWITYKRVDVFVNPVVYANSDDAAYIDPSGLGPTFTYCNSLTDTTSTCKNLSTYTGSFTPATVPVTAYGGNSSRYEANVTVPVTVSQDAWIVVVVWDGRTQPYGSFGADTISFTNPIFVDYNGDGKFTAPCANYSATAGCAFLRPASERPGNVISTELLPDEHRDEYNQVFRILRQVMSEQDPMVE